MKEKLYVCKSDLINDYYFTEKLIKTYLGNHDSEAKNPYYRSAPSVKLYLISRVESALKDENLVNEINRVKLRREKAQIKKEQKLKSDNLKALELKKMIEIYSLEYIIKLSMQYDKKYYIHCGPTNSGKTYNSINTITPQTKGQYLAPLRILAYEVYDKLNKSGILCNFVTGEEEVIVSEARFTSSTVEMCNMSEELDLLIVDEAQLISDEYRGHSYTKAILLSKAKNIHICCSFDGFESLLSLIKKTNMQYEITHYERLVPLVYSGRISSFKCLKPGDAIVVFSRKMVLSLAYELNEAGIKTSVIYGNLPPKNRIDEIERFTSGASSILVCTDAIGLGVSLPIKRVIFFEDSKFDGKQFRTLVPEEVYQIAGRAGRFNLCDNGEYLFWNGLNLTPVNLNSLHTNKVIRLPFPKEILNYDIDLMRILKVWNTMKDTNEYAYQKLDDAATLLNILPYHKYDKEIIFKLITCPFNTSNLDLVSLWLKYSLSILKNKEIYVDEFYYYNDLKLLELYYHKVELYNYMMKIKGETPDTTNLLSEITDCINKILLSNKRKHKNYW